MPATADDDDVVGGCGIGRAPGGRPAGLVGEPLLEDFPGGVARHAVTRRLMMGGSIGRSGAPPLLTREAEGDAIARSFMPHGATNSDSFRP